MNLPVSIALFIADPGRVIRFWAATCHDWASV